MRDKPDTTEIPFGYSQFMVYDGAINDPGSDWTEAHVRQGFARRERAVCMGTLLEFGTAAVSVLTNGPLDLEKYHRVIAVTLTTESGWFRVRGPESLEEALRVDVSRGRWRVTVAQRVTGELGEDVDILIEPARPDQTVSEIVVCDEELDPPDPLIEAAEVMRVE